MQDLDIKSSKEANKWGKKVLFVGNQEIFTTKANAKLPEYAGIFDAIEDILLRANTLWL